MDILWVGCRIFGGLVLSKWVLKNHIRNHFSLHVSFHFLVKIRTVFSHESVRIQTDGFLQATSKSAKPKPFTTYLEDLWKCVLFYYFCYMFFSNHVQVIPHGTSEDQQPGADEFRACGWFETWGNTEIPQKYTTPKN